MKIKHGIFQGGSLSPLLLALVMIPLTLVLRQTKASYKVKNGGKKINHLLLMGDLELFAKNKERMSILVNTVRIFSEDIKMDFGLPRCRVLIMKREKVVKSEGISMPNGNMMKNIEDSGYKYAVKYEEMKGQIRKK